jgi:hypothetical protein
MVARTKTWIANETLTAADLNAEFDPIIAAISTGTADHIDLTDVYAWTGAHTWGVDDTGVDVKFFGDAAGAFGIWDTSANGMELRGATAAGPGTLLLSTAEVTVVDGNILGRIDFQAPLDIGLDSDLVGASIWAEADDIFSDTKNDTDLVFAVAESEIAAERMRLSYDGATVGLTFSGVTTVSTSAGALNLTPASGSAIVLDGTINVDAGVVTGATSITSTAFVGDITGDLTGNADTFTATANNSTNETVYPVFVDGATGTQGAETDTGLTYNPSTGLLSSVGVTASGTVTYGSLSDGSITITAFVDEDNMASNSATLVPTQQSVKAYVDGQTHTTNATTVTITDNESTNETNAIIFTAGGDVDGGDLGLESDGNLTYNPSSGLLSATAVTATGVVTAATCEATGDTSAGDNAAMGYTSAEGLILAGQGSTNDVTIKNDADGNIMVCKTGGTVVDFPGKVGIGVAHTEGTLHVCTAAVSGLTAYAYANDLVVERGDDDGGISILGADANHQQLYFGSLSDNGGARIRWKHDANLMTIQTLNDGDSIVFGTANAVEAMRIDASQNVGIAMTPGGSHKLDVTGSAGLSTGTAWTNTSDSRIKTNIQTITGALAKINQLRPVSFQYTDQYLSVHDEIDGAIRYNSFIAEEYEDIFPDAVTIGGNLEKITDGQTNEKEILIEKLKQFTPHDLPIYLVAAVQELATRLDEANATLALLQRNN